MENKIYTEKRQFFALNLQKIYTGQFFFIQTCLWCLWQISGMSCSSILIRQFLYPSKIWNTELNLLIFKQHLVQNCLFKMIWYNKR